MYHVAAGKRIIKDATRASIADLDEARAYTLGLTGDLRDEQMSVPKLETINPILWELGHIAYFAEFWTLRNLLGAAPIVRDADRLYDSAKVAHDTRWALPLPSRAQTTSFMSVQLEALTERAEEIGRCDQGAYFLRLALHHEDMHGEALLYTRQTLAYAAPNPPPPSPVGTKLDGAARISGGRYAIGSVPGDGFVFDNEKWQHEIELDSFEISRAPVTNAQFADFVEDGGYENRRFWSDAGWSWARQAQATQPLYWESLGTGRSYAGFARRHFDRIQPLRANEPVCHVNHFEALAYCSWAGRRLPTEAEWEVAATGGARTRFPWGNGPPMPDYANLDGTFGDVCDVSCFEAGESPTGLRQMIGNVWEWTDSVFEPYPGFAIDPYAEYSAPWFGSHMVLRGGAWSTRGRLISTRWRNFYRPHRRDIITGFRTVKR